MMRDSGTGLLLTGTSMNSLEYEKQFIAVARDLGMPSLTVLDFWSNYRHRFSDEKDRLVYLPDRIAVMDDETRRQMTAERIDPSLLVVTGQPAFDDLASARQSFTAETRARTRAELGLEPEDLLIVFASQPLARVFGDNISSPLYLGFDERGVLTNLIAALELIAGRLERRLTLAIRPHPKESAASFSQYESGTINILVSTNGSSRDILMSADLVAGMNSNLLVEACYLGCIVVSLQPGLRGSDVLPTNGAGFSRAVYREADVEPELELMMTNEAARVGIRNRLREFQSSGDAARRVVDLIYQMIGVEE